GEACRWVELVSAASVAKLLQRIVQKRLRLFVAATLLHVGEMRLVGLGLGNSRWIVPIAAGRKSGVRTVNRLGNLVVGNTSREIANRFVPLRIPVGNGDPLSMKSVILLAHRTRADARPTNGVTP